MSRSWKDALLGNRVAGRAAVVTAGFRVAAAIVFVVFGVGKFSQHRSEVASFTEYGLPSPDAFTYAIGVLEIGGGLLLLAGILTRLAALVLAGDMVAAIVLSGIGEGELVSLTLAPALLVVMLVLLWTGPGAAALDTRLLARPL